MEGRFTLFLKGLLILVFLVLLGRLSELQIIKGEYYQSLANDNRIKRVTIPARRGNVKARGGEILVGTKDDKRFYSLGSLAAHLTGYLSRVNENEVGKVDPSCPEKGPWKSGNFIGRTGLEEEYDCSLKGIDGEELLEVDAKGNVIRKLGEENPIAGNDLMTTIDYGLQKKTAQSMKGTGAIVATNGTGQVLALYSSPSFDPQKIQESVNSPALPLFNRFLDGLYHPGSTFKIVTSTAALEEGKIDANFLYNDPGVVKINGFSYSNWFFSQYGRTEGEIDITKAIARSTDTFFYKIGEKVGIDDLAKWSVQFGLDKKTGVDLPNEAEGLVPDPVWKRKVKGELWFLGDTYNVSIGQGDVAITPLAANMLTAVIANGGKICAPYLNNQSSSVNRCKDLNLKPETLNLIKEGMIGACSQGGTAFPFFDWNSNPPGHRPYGPVACKTGTAETSEKDRTHAWFSAFVPTPRSLGGVGADNIVITVLVEKGGEGSKVAAPIAKDILTYYFGRK